MINNYILEKECVPYTTDNFDRYTNIASVAFFLRKSLVSHFDIYIKEQDVRKIFSEIMKKIIVSILGVQSSDI